MFSISKSLILKKCVQFQCYAFKHTLQPIKMSHNVFNAIEDSKAPPLIIMHGLFGSKANWNSLCKAFVKQLQPHRNVFSVDARNHGDSLHSDSHTYHDLVEDVRFFLQELGVNKASLLGHSMGGRAVMLCALKYPQLIDKLIIADISPVKDTNFGSTPTFFNILQSVQFPKNVTISQARTEIDKQLAQQVDDKGIRAFLLTNLVQKEDGSYGWRMNVPVLANSFVEHIGKFPDVGDAKYEGDVLFVAGGASDYVKNYSVEPIEMSYTMYAPLKSNTQPPLIVMHGLFGSKSNWSTICKGILYRMKRRIIAVDARNHGDSPHAVEHTYEHLVEDVRMLIRQRLNSVKVDLMGHSMGGRTMMLFALKYPEMINKVIVVDISPITTGAQMERGPGILDVLKSVQMPKNVPRVVARRDVGRQLSKSSICHGLELFLLMNLIEDGDTFKWRINIPVLLENYDKHLRKFPQNLDGAKFDGAALFVGGGKSDFLPKKDHPQIKKLFPNAEFVYIDGAGHWLHAERPTEFLQICTQFLNK